MKATNKTKFHHIVEQIQIPDSYKEKPAQFDNYVWETQDRDVVAIKQFNDHHLINTYNMLTKTILFAREKAKHTMLTSQMRRVVTLCDYHLQYIGYELYLRLYPEGENKESEKYKMIPETKNI